MVKKELFRPVYPLNAQFIVFEGHTIEEVLLKVAEWSKENENNNLVSDLVFSIDPDETKYGEYNITVYFIPITA